MEGLLVSVATLAGAAGYVATQLIDIIKPMLDPYFVTAPQVKAPSLKLLTLGLTALCAVIVGLLAESLGLLAPGGFWLVVVASFPAVGGWFQIESRRKSAKKTAQNGGVLYDGFGSPLINGKK